MRRRLRSLEGRRIGTGFAYAAIGTLVMSLVLMAWRRSATGTWEIALGGVLLGGIAYLAMMRLFRVPELDAAYRGIMRRLRPGRSPGGIS